MVTITIVVLVTGIVLVQYSSFNSSVLLTSQAYKTAFDLRETQSLAISSRGKNNTFREEYGLYFNQTAPGQYILFQDRNAVVPAHYNSNPDPDLDEAIGAPTIIDPRFTISLMCVATNAASVCGAGTTDVTSLAVSFERPDFDAAFYSTGPVIANIQTALIYITSISDNTSSKIVRISSSGQISVENAP
jgi:hypothetical protein